MRRIVFLFEIIVLRGGGDLRYTGKVSDKVSTFMILEIQVLVSM